MKEVSTLFLMAMRMTAAERREQIVTAAAPAFARRGYFGTPTTEIASAAGVAEGYLFRLFGTKEALFVAVVERCFGTIAEILDAAAARSRARSPQERLEAIGKGYVEVLAQRDLLLLQLHAAAASTEPAIRDAVRAGFERLVELLRSRSGASDAELQETFAIGMLSNFIAAMGAEQIAEPWARTLVGDLAFPQQA